MKFITGNNNLSTFAGKKQVLNESIVNLLLIHLPSSELFSEAMSLATSTSG